MPFGQVVGVCLPPSLVGGLLGERQQLLAVAALDSVDLQEPADVTRLQAALRQLVPADLGLRPAKYLRDVLGSLSRAGAEATKLGGKTPSPDRRAAGGGHLGAPLLGGIVGQMVHAGNQWAEGTVKRILSSLDPA